MKAFAEIRDASLAVAAALAALTVGLYIADAIGLSRIWLPQIILLSTAILLTRTSLFESSFRPLAGLKTGLFLAPAATFSAYSAAVASSFLFPPSPELLKTIDLMRPTTIQELLSSILLSFVVVAPAEEIIFRGIVHRKLRKLLPRNFSLLLSSVIFAAAHLDATRLLPTLTIGVFAAYAFDKTDSLTPAMIIHGFNNSIYFLLLFLSSATFSAEQIPFH
ncbi:MAG: CPBP family intramembrane metalloprotease [Candidatus Caldarchaeum sp.]|nr:CPBP family intramembrane metalloprotease [Candidatus Caldarchaeum sp.]MCX8201017.1 CPBP family intramembrane metalloprotease [Candidatus Caldarchaeum sp.]